ncbi:hypothetical protein [Pontibacter sp. G13]|uniref:hypothetical protein n=1 Tax=Pontibacter sp. G13 TaxID=3074898 RepID=UPI00288AFB2B|nr:hypothetical protein [Pontibacter sp. G13]WNJ17265.1 hypothetical protein RJD25_20635 [Pontibacter sp. G13]
MKLTKMFTRTSSKLSQIVKQVSLSADQDAWRPGGAEFPAEARWVVATTSAIKPNPLPRPSSHRFFC